jgi:hypothetical protein
MIRKSSYAKGQMIRKSSYAKGQMIRKSSNLKVIGYKKTKWREQDY